jgi:hypothetical protein
LDFRGLSFDQASRFERQGTSLADTAEQFTRFDPEPPSERQDRTERGIALTVLDRSDVVWRERRALCELLESEP